MGRSVVPCVAVTGCVASGKSLFGRLLAERGAEVLDADEVIHRLQCPGGALSRAIADSFGKVFLHPDGSVNRPELAKVVFGDPEALSRLNRLAHPLAREVFRAWRGRDGSGRDGSPSRPQAWAKVGLIPLLFESGWEEDWDFTVCLRSPQESRLCRSAERGWTEAMFSEREAAQWPEERKAAASAMVIDNDGDLGKLAIAADDLKKRILDGK